MSSSSLSSDFCSGVRVDSHFSLSNLGAAPSEAGSPLAAEDDGEDLGAPKNEVRLASFLGFLRSFDDADRGPALRLSEAIRGTIMENPRDADSRGQRRRYD